MPAGCLRFPDAEKNNPPYGPRRTSRFLEGATGPAENSQASFVTGRPRKKENPAPRARTILRDETRKFDRSALARRATSRTRRRTTDREALPFPVDRPASRDSSLVDKHPTRRQTFSNSSRWKFQRVASRPPPRRDRFESPPYFFPLLPRPAGEPDL